MYTENLRDNQLSVPIRGIQFFCRRELRFPTASSLLITDTGLQLNQQLRQKPIAKACAEWINEKVEIRTTRESNLIHGKMYHIANNGIGTRRADFVVAGKVLVELKVITELEDVHETQLLNYLKAYLLEVGSNQLR